MRLLPGAVLCLALLAVPSGAQGAQRYAAPNATGVGCTQTEPCSFPDAVNGAFQNDEVIVTAGEYTISGAPLNVVTGGLQIHGDLGGPMPRVTAALGGLPAIQMNSEGSSISYLEVVNKETEGVGIRCRSTSRVERVRATGIGAGAAGLNQSQSCLVRDSLLRGDGANSLGMESLATSAGEPTSNVRNVTAIATGANSVGILCRYTGPAGGLHTLALGNSIASGSTFDLQAEDSQGPGVIEVSNSNFDSVSTVGAASISGPANQLIPPAFVDAVAGDFREAPGSPTIDAGSGEGIGALDLAGNPRVLGAAPDIGAFEFIPPPPPAAGALTSLTVAPKAFRPLKKGEAIASAKKPKPERGTTVRYALTGAATVAFTVERALRGRSVGGKCAKQTPANRRKRKCTRFRKLKGAFSDQGAAGPNSFRFSGRLAGKALKPGRYRLVGRSGDTSRSARFAIAP